MVALEDKVAFFLFLTLGMMGRPALSNTLWLPFQDMFGFVKSLLLASFNVRFISSHCLRS